MDTTDPLLQEEIIKRDYTTPDAQRTGINSNEPPIVPNESGEAPPVQSDVHEMQYDNPEAMQSERFAVERYKTTAAIIIGAINKGIKKFLRFGFKYNAETFKEQLSPLPEDVQKKFIIEIAKQENKLTEIISLNKDERQKLNDAMCPVLAKYHINVVPNRFAPEFELIAVTYSIITDKFGQYNNFIAEMKDSLQNVTKSYIQENRTSFWKLLKLGIASLKMR